MPIKRFPSNYNALGINPTIAAFTAKWIGERCTGAIQRYYGSVTSTGLARAAGSANVKQLAFKADREIVSEQLLRIRSSKEFCLSHRLIRFLEFTVEKVLSGSAAELKEYLIGVEVYGRGENFDPKSDSIVRSEAVRLRDRLQRYYEAEGSTDQLRISYRKGCYAPVFESRLATNRASASPVQNTIAVLPFVNVGASEEPGFFSEGLTDELISAFARVPGLRVVARSSSFQFQATAVDVREAGRRLNAEVVLEGSVRYSRGRVRIHTQLIEVTTGLHLWSGTFERQMNDLFAIQATIASAILTALHLTAPPVPLVHEDEEAYVLCLKARQHRTAYSVEAAEKSCTLYERALAINPRSARAWSGLALSRNFLAHRGQTSDANIEQARYAIAKALEADSTSAEVHSANALLLGFNDRKWKDAERSFRKAMELAPGEADILHRAGICLLLLGHFDEAEGLLARAAGLDPLGRQVQVDLGLLMRIQGRCDEAIGYCQAALEIDPHHREAEWQLGLALQRAGRFSEAMASFGRVTTTPEEELPALGTIGNCYLAWGRSELALSTLQRLEQATGQDPATMLHARALIYVALDRPEAALACLEQCVRSRSSRLVLLKHDWRFASLSSTPGFQAILKELGF